MTYQTAIQAIVVSNSTRTDTYCEDTPENFAVLYMEASDHWIGDESGDLVFFCDERGNDWTVRIARRP